MSRSLNSIFPAGNTTDICLAQTTAGAASLIINGNLAQNNQVSFAAKGYSRSVSISSTGDIQTVVFTITGMQNGIVVSDTITGVNNNTVYNTTQVFDVITSVVADRAVATAATVGSGYNGFFNIIGINLERNIINYTASSSLLTADNVIQLAVFGGISDITNNGRSYLTNLTNNFNIFTVSAPAIFTDNQFVYTNNSDSTFSYLLFRLIGTAATIGTGVRLNFIQA